MATVIYDEQWGARTTKVFGCSFKSINVQMGFNSQPIVFTVTVVEESSQDFTLDRDDVRSVQYISFGELSIFGIVQSWERTTTDIQGTGIYTIRLTDCRTVLDAAHIANVYVPEPETEVALIDSNIVYIGTQGNTEQQDGSSRQEDSGVPFSTIIDRVEAATLKYGNNNFEVDMTALRDLTNANGEGISQYYIQGEVRSLVSTITEFCETVGAEWWVESNRKSVVDDTIIIAVKVIRRLNKIGNPLAIEMDDLATLHVDKIIRRTDGYENNPDVVTNKVLWGGLRRNLQEAHGVSIKQFWGFDEDGVPLDSPSYVMPNEPQGRRCSTTTDEMEDAINGDLDDVMDADQLSALKRYANDYWGKKFYTSLSRETLADGGNNLTTYPEIIPAGWWEGDTPPRGAQQFDDDILNKLTTTDGRWGPFTKLSNVFLSGSGTLESPLEAHYVTWSPIVANSVNMIQREGESFVKCTLEQAKQHIVMTLPVALTRYYIDPTTGVVDEDRLTRHSELNRVWLPIMDRSVHYGPWSNTTLRFSAVPSPGISEVDVDSSLVPWTFGTRGMLHATAMEQLTTIATKKIDLLPKMSVINTGQLEVADIPRVNIGQAVGLGGSITEIFVRFDQGGVTTRYSMNLYTKELGEFKRRKQREAEDRQEEEEKEPSEDFPTTKDDMDSPPEPEAAPETEEAVGPSPDEDTMKYVYDKPEGGMGVVEFKEGGPFYTVRRMNYADIDSQTFAGGLNITGSYFLAEWHNVRNLAEPESSPGLIPVGTRVTVSIFSESEHGPYVAYMEQTPQVFSPPPVEEEEP